MDPEPQTNTPQRDPEEEVETITFDVTVSRDEFWGTKPLYATYPFVSYDGANLHITLLATAPSPVPEEDQNQPPTTVVARIVMPPQSAEGLANLILDVVSDPKPAGPLKDFLSTRLLTKEEE